MDGALKSYSVLGTPGVGAHAVQTLDLAGGIELDMEITRYEPPSGSRCAPSPTG